MFRKLPVFIFAALLCGCLSARAGALLEYSARVGVSGFEAALSAPPVKGLQASAMYSVMEGRNKGSGNNSDSGMHFANYGAYVSGRRMIVGSPMEEIGTTYFGFDLTVDEGFEFAFTGISFSFLAPEMLSGGVYIDIRSSVDGYGQSLGHVLGTSDAEQTVMLNFLDAGGAASLSNVRQPVTFRIYAYKDADAWMGDAVGIKMTDFVLHGSPAVPEPATWAALLSLVAAAVALRSRLSLRRKGI